MTRLFQIAWRNVWRTPRRTVVTVATMTLALLVMILYSSVFEGFLRDLERDAVEIELGDLQVHAEGYRDRPSLYTMIEDPEPIAATLEAEGYRVTAHLLAGGLAASNTTATGAQFRGLDLESNARVSAIADEIEAGVWLDAGDPQGVVLGRQLARTLDIRVGDELVALSQAYDGSMANDLFIVRGVLGSVGEGTDRGAVLMLAESFRTLFGVPAGAHQLILRRPEAVPLEQALERVSVVAAGHETQTWRQLMPMLATMLDSARGIIILVFATVYIVIAILVLNAMLMAVFERIRELGVLKAIGLSPRHVLALVVIEGMLQALVAIAIGGTLAIPGLIYLRDHGLNLAGLADVTLSGMSLEAVWYGVISPRVVATPILVLLFLVLLGVVIPGIKASRLDPVKAMRHQ